MTREEAERMVMDLRTFRQSKGFTQHFAPKLMELMTDPRSALPAPLEHPDSVAYGFIQGLLAASGLLELSAVEKESEEG